MIDGEKLASEAAAFKNDARKRFEAALTALIALAYEYKIMGANFLWDKDPDLDREANRILRGMSEGAMEDAKKRALRIVEGMNLDEFEEAWEYESNKTEEDGMLYAFDMAGSHLKELLEVWIALAFVNNLGKEYLKISIIRYLSNPYLSALWKNLPGGIIKWGSGFQRNLINQIALIGQDGIISAARFAEWLDESRKGATYYIRRRGSTFHCPQCDSECGIPIPITMPFEESHARCMCWPEYHYEEIPQ